MGAQYPFWSPDGSAIAFFANGGLQIMELAAESVREVLPAMKAGGGYVYGTDHSVPSCVSLEDFRRFVELGKTLGAYA